MERQCRKRSIKKMFITLVFTLLLIGMFTAELGAWGYGHVYVVVRNRYYRPVPHAYVSVGGRTCYGYGNGYYRQTTGLGYHRVYVAGRCYDVHVRPGYNFVYAYLW